MATKISGATGSKRPKAASAAPQTGSYKHTEPKAIIRPEIGVQNYAAAQDKFKRAPTKYRYDDSLAPELTWDSQNPARERGEALIAKIAEITEALTRPSLPAAAGGDQGQGEGVRIEQQRLLGELKATAAELNSLSKPFLNWSGKAERTSFDVPTLPLFIHERLSTEAILETLKSHRASAQTDWQKLNSKPHAGGLPQSMRMAVMVYGRIAWFVIRTRSATRSRPPLVTRKRSATPTQPHRRQSRPHRRA